MKFEKDYSNHSRWNDLSDKHKNSLLIPNLFANILHEHKDKIPNVDTLRSAIETWTFDAKTSTILANHFDIVFTIELYPDVNPHDHMSYRDIHEQYSTEYDNITFLYGQLDEIIPEILTELPDERFMFLLDFHRNSTNPMRNELEIIKKYSNNKNHVFLIDDCNFLGTLNFPTEEELRELLFSINPDYTLEKINDGNQIMLVY